MVNQDLSRQPNVWCINLESGDKYWNKKWRNYYDCDEFDKKNPPRFGVFAQECVVGVLLDIDRGILNFFKDGNDLGQAFIHPLLKEGLFYPFVQV